MKKNIILFFILILTIGLSYLFVFKSDKAGDSLADKPLIEIEKIKAILLTSEYAQVSLELRDGSWWVTQPQIYLGHQELIEKSLMSMVKLEPVGKFKLQEDRFGFQKPQAFIEFTYTDEQRVRLSVGSVPAPGQNLYVLNKDTGQVYVFHNVWGQFFYYPAKEYFHKNLPIIGQQVKKIQFFSKEKLSWSMESQGLKEIQLVYNGESHLFEKSNFIWFFNLLREFKVENLEFSEKEGPQSFSERLIVETEKGNIIFGFDRKLHKIMIPSLNVFADYQAYSLTSLGEELEKVISSEKK